MNNFFIFLFFRFARLVIGKTNYQARKTIKSPVIYYANHGSNIDSLIILLSLTEEERNNTRFIAASDYWDKGFIRPFLLKNVFNGVTINRKNISKENNPINFMRKILENNQSIVIFPEGSRNIVSQDIENFKSGIFHLAKSLENIPLIPVYLNNVQRMMPKGTFFPIPIFCNSIFGSPIYIKKDETKTEFLNRLKRELKELSL